MNIFHVHDFDQVLYVTKGEGIIATEKEEIRITPGDFVVIPAGEKHWHGATPESDFAHIAISIRARRRSSLTEDAPLRWRVISLGPRASCALMILTRAGCARSNEQNVLLMCARGSRDFPASVQLWFSRLFTPRIRPGDADGTMSPQVLLTSMCCCRR